MEILGSGYVIEHCVSAFSKNQEEKAYKNYMANGIFVLANQYSISHGGEKVINKQFYELFEKPKPVEGADSIKKRILEGLKGK